MCACRPCSGRALRWSASCACAWLLLEDVLGQPLSAVSCIAGWRGAALGLALAPAQTGVQGYTRVSMPVRIPGAHHISRQLLPRALYPAALAHGCAGCARCSWHHRRDWSPGIFVSCAAHWAGQSLPQHSTLPRAAECGPIRVLLQGTAHAGLTHHQVRCKSVPTAQCAYCYSFH